MSPYETRADIKTLTFTDEPYAGVSPRRHGLTPLIATHGEITQATYWWLIELFASDGTPRNIYWAGRSNRVAPARDGSVEVSQNPHRARRIPLALDDLASDIAAALNKLPRAEGNTDVWRSAQHAFV